MPVTDNLQKMFVDGHNEKRNLIASGSVAGFGPAKRMASVVWCPELASLAELNTKQCVMEHDKCHNTGNVFTNLMKTQY